MPDNGALQPRLSTLSTMAMSFAILNTWIAIAGSIGIILPSGGSAAMLYGFIFCVICCLCVAASLGELSAIWPTAGGQYHFVFALCSERWKRPMSFVVGWVNIVGWLVVVTTEDFFGAQFISAAIVVASNGVFKATPAKTYGIYLAILVVTTAVNIWGNKILGRWNDAALYWSVFGFIIISIVLLALSDKTSAEFVFADFQNLTGWPDGVAWIEGLLQSALSLVAFDVVLHMTEEMPDPARDSPRAMIYSVVVGGVTGGIFILVLLFSLANRDVVLSTPTGMPIVELIFQATKSRAAAAILSLMLGVCFINGTNASITSVSRLLYAMARDRGIIFHEYFAHVQPGLNVPVRTIMLCFFFNLLFGLLFLGPTVAFGAYVASCTIFLDVSYAIPVLVVLIRGRKALEAHQTEDTPFKMGRWGLAVNLVAAIYLIITSVFFCFPPMVPVSADKMNYVSVVIGIFAVMLLAYWLVCGEAFQGPHDAVAAEGQQAFGRRDSNVVAGMEGQTRIV